MHFDESDIGEFFDFLKDMEVTVVGILQEPFSEDRMSFNYKNRNFRHNYASYFQKFGFHLIDFNQTEKKFGTFYFSTK